MYEFGGGMFFFGLAVLIVEVAIGACVLYFVIKLAVLAALRKHDRD
jgi:hypothetical protein